MTRRWNRRYVGICKDGKDSPCFDLNKCSRDCWPCEGLNKFIIQHYIRHIWVELNSGLQLARGRHICFISSLLSAKSDLSVLSEKYEFPSCNWMLTPTLFTCLATSRRIKKIILSLSFLIFLQMHIPGHAGYRGNEEADRLSREGAVKPLQQQHEERDDYS